MKWYHFKVQSPHAPERSLEDAATATSQLRKLCMDIVQSAKEGTSPPPRARIKEAVAEYHLKVTTTLSVRETLTSLRSLLSSRKCLHMALPVRKLFKFSKRLFRGPNAKLMIDSHLKTKPTPLAKMRLLRPPITPQLNGLTGNMKHICHQHDH